MSLDGSCLNDALGIKLSVTVGKRTFMRITPWGGGASDASSSSIESITGATGKGGGAVDG